MARQIRLMGVVSIVALIVGFAGTGTAWGEDVAPDDGRVGVVKDCRPCTGEISFVRVQVNQNLGVGVGWSAFSVTAGQGDSQNPDNQERHEAKAVVSFTVDVTKFQIDANERPEDVRSVEGLPLGNITLENLPNGTVSVTVEPFGEGIAGPTRSEASQLETSIELHEIQDLKAAMLWLLSGRRPISHAAIGKSKLVNGAEYTFHPRFQVSHLNQAPPKCEEENALGFGITDFPTETITGTRGKKTTRTITAP